MAWVIIERSSSALELSVQTLQNRLGNSTLVVQILAQPSDNLQLLLDRQAIDGGLNHISNGSFVHGNKAMVVHVRKEAHDELAVHPIGDTAMTRDRFTKIFNFKGSLKPGSEEATERSD